MIHNNNLVTKYILNNLFFQSVLFLICGMNVTKEMCLLMELIIKLDGFIFFL